MPVLILPDPAACRVLRETLCPNDDGTLEYVVVFAVRDVAHGDSLQAVLGKARKEGYAVEIKLLHYEGHRDMRDQAAARKARKAGRP